MESFRPRKVPQMSSRSLNWLKFGGLVGLAFALGLLFAGLLDLPSRTSAQQATPAKQVIAPVPAPSIPEARPLQELSEAFAGIADAVRPSVVFISAQHTERNAQRRQGPQGQVPRGMEPFFFERRPPFQQGSGTGFVLSQDGYIATNNHVVEGSDKVTVRLLDRREFEAKVVGADPNTDVAVLKIEAKGLKPIAMGNSDGARVGEWVLAIGNPLGEGLTFTVTSGILSAKGRRLDGLRRSNLSIDDFLQTDAAINPGNSGGPLVNVRGEVIGINSAIASETGFYSGYGFAIPINLARNVINQLITDGKVHRAALGISIGEVSVQDAQYVGLSEPRGVLVSDFPGENSPAAKAGMEAGDVIVAVDGKQVERVGQLQQEIGFRRPGESVKVEVVRKGGVRKTFNIKLQELVDEQLARNPTGNDDSASPNAEGASANTVLSEKLGISVETLDAQTAKQFQLPSGFAGVVVSEVVPGGPAWQLLTSASRNGVDIITAVEGQQVKNEDDLRKFLKSQKAGTIVTLRVASPVGEEQVRRRVVRVQLKGE